MPEFNRKSSKMEETKAPNPALLVDKIMFYAAQASRLR